MIHWVPFNSDTIHIFKLWESSIIKERESIYNRGSDKLLPGGTFGLRTLCLTSLATLAYAVLCKEIAWLLLCSVCLLGSNWFTVSPVTIQSLLPICEVCLPPTWVLFVDLSLLRPRQWVWPLKGYEKQGCEKQGHKTATENYFCKHPPALIFTIHTPVKGKDRPFC